MSFERCGPCPSTWTSSSAKLTASIKNDAGFPVDISWVNYEGDLQATQLVPCGGEWSQSTFNTHPWCVSRAGGAQELVRICFNASGSVLLSEALEADKAPGEPEQMRFLRIPAERRSAYDRDGDVTVTVQNDQDFPVAFTWIDYSGDLQHNADCAPGATWSVATNSLHPWSISRSGSDEELACVLFQPCAEGVPLVVSHVVAFCGAAPAPHQGSMSRSRQRSSKRKHHNCGEAHGPGGLPACSMSSPSALCWAPVPRMEGCGKIYEMKAVHGFTLFLEQGALDGCAGLEGVISADLLEVARVMPKAVVELLRGKVAIWINQSFKYPGDDKPMRGLCCHWSAGWLVPNGNMAEKEGCVECYTAQDWVDWHAVQPAMILHELCHGYHKHSPPRVDAVIAAAYDECMSSGLYDRGEYMCEPMSSKPYGASNKAEFFSETCEAFFSSARFRNDFFPYVHAELKGFDPAAYRMCEEAFGISGDELVAQTEFPKDWAARFSKLNIGTLEQRFKASDTNGDGVLDMREFVGAIESFNIGGLTREEARAALRFADLNRDGVVSYPEFVSWVVSTTGAYVRQ